MLLIRHADKADNGDGLSPAGVARAHAYIDYFKNFKLGSMPVKLDAIFASADSTSSHRPRLTVEPLAQALGLAVDTSFKNKEYQRLVDSLRAGQGSKSILVCWHHGELPALLHALDADPNALLPDGRWPEDEYRWVIALHYGHEGQLLTAQRISEGF